MKPFIRFFLALLLALTLSSFPSLAQDPADKCNSLDPKSALAFVPDFVPLENSVIPVDTDRVTALRFPDGTRIAIAPLKTSGYGREIERKYEFIVVSETKVIIQDHSLPAGLIGLALEPEPGTEAPACTLMARDFTGREIGRIGLELNNSAPAALVSLTPAGEKGFLLRIRSYVVEGRQR